MRFWLSRYSFDSGNGNNMNSLGHFLISLVKSILRIGACVWTVVSKDVAVLAIGFGIAELLGILEEVVDKRV